MQKKKINERRLRYRISNTEPSKNNEIYSTSLYWSKKPYNICDILIEELSQEKDTIFDPFMGSGVTVIESVKNKYNRKAIGCEINEMPIFIVETLLKNYDISKFEKDAKKMLVSLDDIERYYYTKCPKCGEQAIMHSMLFDIDKNNEYIAKNLKCNCKECGNSNKKPDKYDIKKLIDDYNIDNISFEIMHENSKLAVYKNETIADIFTNRNLKVLDCILEEISKYKYSKDIFKYILMSILHLSKITDTHSNSQWPLWIPKINCVEKNVVRMMRTRILDFKKTISYINSNYDKGMNFKIIKKGSQYINSCDIEDETVDLIITDPPYLGQVAYSEYMQLYKPFLNLSYNLQDEIIVTSSPERKRSKNEYFSLLNSVFNVCSLKLKTDGYFCMYFHDSDLDTWDRLITIMQNNGFKYLFQEHINKSNTLKNIISPKKSLSGDALLVFKKTKVVKTKEHTRSVKDDVSITIINFVRNMLEKKGPLTTTEIYDKGLIEFMVKNDLLHEASLKYKSIVNLMETAFYWNSSTNRWEIKKIALK